MKLKPQGLFRAALRHVWPYEKMQVPKRQTRYCYKDGPMFYLGQQIVKAMEDAGYPAKISECYRTPERQKQLRIEGRTKAGPWESPHQYYEAVDIIHPSLGWNVSRKYWLTLNACMRVIEAKYGVNLIHGHDWNDNGIPVYDDPEERFYDAAHIQLADWKKQRDRHRATIGLEGKPRPPNQLELWVRFEEVLPELARRCARGYKHK
ncbi:hypothetical protein I5192_06920 [Ruegeria sp. SCSIO 43209]|uniref:hypothetical protein n=1 Tax=Ruegeria sp. SCSIO 43209 TaxID=2793010 RepID=UPI001CAA1AEB|nr:hypothetical protein [Ruegeria sp. SCSIO 43209]UAB90387.1 hypothetical protein I5192_06920 [Ruegeria sp. SCSIO 43209]